MKSELVWMKIGAIAVILTLVICSAFIVGYQYGVIKEQGSGELEITSERVGEQSSEEFEIVSENVDEQTVTLQSSQEEACSQDDCSCVVFPIFSMFLFCVVMAISKH